MNTKSNLKNKYAWFNELSAFERISTMLNLFDCCCPLELYFFSTYLSDICFETYVKLAQDEVNKVNYYSNISGLKSYETRMKIALACALIDANNAKCAEVLYNLIVSDLKKDSESWNQLLNSKTLANEVLLILILCANHPAFSFCRKCDVNELLECFKHDYDMLYNNMKQVPVTKVESVFNTVKTSSESASEQPKSQMVKQNALVEFPIVKNHTKLTGSQKCLDVSKQGKIRKIELSGTGRKKSYKIEVTWSDGKKTEVSKTYREICNFHQKLMHHFPLEAHAPGPDIYIPALLDINHNGNVSETPAEQCRRVQDYLSKFASHVPLHVKDSDYVINFFQSTSNNRPPPLLIGRPNFDLSLLNKKEQSSESIRTNSNPWQTSDTRSIMTDASNAELKSSNYLFKNSCENCWCATSIDEKSYFIKNSKDNFLEEKITSDDNIRKQNELINKVNGVNCKNSHLNVNQKEISRVPKEKCLSDKNTVLTNYKNGIPYVTYAQALPVPVDHFHVSSIGTVNQQSQSLGYMSSVVKEEKAEFCKVNQATNSRDSYGCSNDGIFITEKKNNIFSSPSVNEVNNEIIPSQVFPPVIQASYGSESQVTSYAAHLSCTLPFRETSSNANIESKIKDVPNNSIVKNKPFMCGNATTESHQVPPYSLSQASSNHQSSSTINLNTPSINHVSLSTVNCVRYIYPSQLPIIHPHNAYVSSPSFILLNGLPLKPPADTYFSYAHLPANSVIQTATPVLINNKNSTATNDSSEMPCSVCGSTLHHEHNCKSDVRHKDKTFSAYLQTVPEVETCN